MPPPNTPTDPNAQPAQTPYTGPQGRSTGFNARTPSQERPKIAKILPLTFKALLGLHEISQPLLLLTAISVLPSVRSRAVFAWRNSLIPWRTLSTGLWWAALASWLSGQSLYLLTIAFYWRHGPRRNERDVQDR
jgi:hypothetical protein